MQDSFQHHLLQGAYECYQQNLYKVDWTPLHYELSDMVKPFQPKQKPEVKR